MRHPEDYVRDPKTGMIWNKRRQTDKVIRRGLSGRQWVKLRKALQRHHRKNGPVDTTPILIAAPVVEE